MSLRITLRFSTCMEPQTVVIKVSSSTRQQRGAHVAVSILLSRIHALSTTCGALAVDEDPRTLSWLQRLFSQDQTIGPDGMLKWSQRVAWTRAAMVILPTVSKPESAKQVWPICLGVAARRLLCRMLLEKSRHASEYCTKVRSCWFQ